MVKKPRVFYLDFIRATSLVIVFIYHYNCHFPTFNIMGFNSFLQFNANSTWGNIGVSLFFIVSGAALMHTYSDNFNIKQFYSKRFFSIYPQFWLAYLFAFLYFFYMNLSISTVPKYKILLTLFGMDGYFSYLTPTFYILGEWFLGCLIIYYICFPLLRKLVIERPKLLLFCTVITYVVIAQTDVFKMDLDRNFFICVLQCIFGMYYAYYIKKIKIQYIPIALITCIVIIFFEIDSGSVYLISILGIALFLVLSYIGEFLSAKWFRNIIMIISKYSYSIFLVHHVVLLEVMKRFANRILTFTESICLLMLCAVLTAFVAVFVYNTNKKICTYIK